MRSTDSEQIEIVRLLIEKAKITIHLKSEGAILATAQLFLGEVLEINGFTIRESDFDNALWTQPPTFGRNYAKSFYLKDKALWATLTEKIERAYKNKLDEKGVSDALEEIQF